MITRYKFSKYQSFEWKFLLPMHWHYWVIYLIMWSYYLLPNWVTIRIAGGLGKTIIALTNKRLDIARTNMQLCNGVLKLTDQEISNTLQKSLTRLLDALFAGYALQFRNQQSFAQVWSPKMAVQPIIDCLQEGRGCLLLPMHKCEIEYMAHVSNLVKPTIAATLSTPPKAIMFKWMTHRLRKFYNLHLYLPPFNLLAAKRLLSDGHCLYHFFDHDVGKKGAVKSKLFGVDCYTSMLTRNITIKANAKAFFLTSGKDEEGKVYLSTQEFTEFTDATYSDQEVARLMNDWLEEQIISDLPSWTWGHKRFKSVLGKKYELLNQI